MLTAQGKLM